MNKLFVYGFSEQELLVFKGLFEAVEFTALPKSGAVVLVNFRSLEQFCQSFQTQRFCRDNLCAIVFVPKGQEETFENFVDEVSEEEWISFTCCVFPICLQENKGRDFLPILAACKSPKGGFDFAERFLLTEDNPPRFEPFPSRLTIDEAIETAKRQGDNIATVILNKANL